MKLRKSAVVIVQHTCMDMDTNNETMSWPGDASRLWLGDCKKANANQQRPNG